MREDPFGHRYNLGPGLNLGLGGSFHQSSPFAGNVNQSGFFPKENRAHAKNLVALSKTLSRLCLRSSRCREWSLQPQVIRHSFQISTGVIPFTHGVSIP